MFQVRLPRLLVAALLAWPAAANPSPGLTVEEFIAAERAIALQGVLDNIGPNGTQVPGAGPGIVIASPSKTDPNYFYTWSRDAALTLKTLVDEFIAGEGALRVYIEDYIRSQAILQTVTNPSGTLLPAGTGLGEPKYNADGSRFNGNWGRPQRDGPALRATALITYANYLIAHGEAERVKTAVWPVIANDLSYVGQYWNSTGFDLWEEVSGSSFFTTQAQYRSLVEGAALASSLGVSCTGCSQAPDVLCFLNTFWNGQYFTANINGPTGRSGIDANVMLGAISVFDVAAPCDSPSLQPCHSRQLANFKVFVDTFRNASLYPINAHIASTSGVALGRYPEDTYYNGNPWYLITLGAAEFLYDAVAQWTHQGSITVDATSLPFFRTLYPNAKATTYKRCKKSGPFRKITDAALAYADSFVAVAQQYTPADGTLAEQFTKTAGDPISARRLTWSFAAFVSMAARRAGHFPPSWLPSSSATPPPSTCPQPSPPPQGTYAPATAAGAPNITTGCLSTVLFAVNASTYYGENVYLSGNSSGLGAWSVDNAQPLMSSNYTAARPLWFAQLALEAGEVVSYKYVRQEDCGREWIWETGNRTLVVPACVEGSTEVLAETDDAWTGAVGTPGGC